mgnify:CR=1 FL=1
MAESVPGALDLIANLAGWSDVLSLDPTPRHCSQRGRLRIVDGLATEDCKQTIAVAAPSVSGHSRPQSVKPAARDESLHLTVVYEVQRATPKDLQLALVHILPGLNVERVVVVCARVVVERMERLELPL